MWKSRSPPTHSGNPDSESRRGFLFYYHQDNNTSKQDLVQKSPTSLLYFALFCTFTAKFTTVLKRAAFIVISLFLSLTIQAQNPTVDSVASQKSTSQIVKPIDSTFVVYYPVAFDSLFLLKPQVIDTSAFNAIDFDVLSKRNTIYSSLSNTGLAHQSMRYHTRNHTGFDMVLPSYAAYVQTDESMATFQSVLPYSEVRYVMTSGDKEQHLDVKFGRQFLPRFFLSFNFKSDYSPGIYKNNATSNNSFWINGNYTTKNHRYGVLAYWFRNKLDMQENGGIVDDEAYISHTENNAGVLATNLTSATNYVKASGFGLEHYFNLLSRTKNVQNKEEKPLNDSLANPQQNDTLTLDNDSNAPVLQTITQERKFTLGRICHSFKYQRNQLFYNESAPGVEFYSAFDTLMDQIKSTDTTIVRSIKNSVQWNSLGYQKYSDDIPFYVYGGVEYGIYRVSLYDYVENARTRIENYSQLIVNGGIITNLFKSTRLSAQAHLVTLGYQIGDFDADAQWRQYLGTQDKNFGITTLQAKIRRQSANWFEQNYYSNHFRWENDFKAATYLVLNANYQYRWFQIGFKQTSINNLIYFGLDAKPIQNDAFVSVSEAYGSTAVHLRRFDIEGFFSLQKASNEEVIHLPLFMGRLRFGLSQPIFHKAATLQPSITVNYFTKYYADAYMPALRCFYLQNEVKIGNFPFIDLAIAIKVKKANVYVAYSNMFLLTGNCNSFIAPHYPMRDSKFFIGINWRLFN